ncbi:MAG: carbohydrate ABC transporter substrate-binding protein [Lachnospiraceae bacterium]|nr:carbohydrate ABC transporter substrate-binding protein [Lachnospiraceae bacterium]
MKKTVTLMGAFLIALSMLCGCGKKDGALTVYIVRSEALYADAAGKFAQEHPEVKMNLVYLESYDEVKERLDTELMSGEGPDVLLFNSLYNAVDPYKLSAGKALLALDEQVEALPEGSYLDTIIRAGRLNGHQYFIPLSWNLLQAYSTQEKAEKISESGDLYAALAAEAQALEGDEAYGASSLQLGRGDVLNLFLETSGSGLIDTESGESAVEEEEFRRMADFVKVFYDNMEKTRTISGRYQNDFAGAVSHFTWLLENYSFMNNLRYYQTVYPKMVNEEMSFAPFERMDGDGLTAQVIQYGAVNANTRNAEDAWKLLKYLMDAPMTVNFPKYEAKSVYYAPVSAAVYEESVETLSSESGFGPGWQVEPLNEANGQLLLEIPGRIQEAVIPNGALGNLMQECMEPYFLGKDSFDNCYDKMMQRMKLYLNE